MEEKEDVVETKVTESDHIWDKIKGLKLNLFALPEQTLDRHADRMKITDDAVHLRLKSQAVLAAMEEALKGVDIPETKEWDITQTTRFTVVRLARKQ